MATNLSGLRSPLGRVRSLGSAKEGMHHWWAQRVTAIALIPLTLWFVVSVLKLAGGGYADYRAWMSGPFNPTAMALFIVVAFHHARLGLQVIIEDYVSSHGLRTATNMVVQFLCYGFGALSIISILIVAFGR